MFGIFGGKPKDGPPNSMSEAKKLMERLGPARGGEIVRAAAMSGNVFCQVFMSQMALCLLADEESEKIKRDLEIFTEMAAKSGDAGSQFNLGKLYMAKIDANVEYFSSDDIENIKQAKHWYSMAAKQGLREAKASLKNLEVFEF